MLELDPVDIKELEQLCLWLRRPPGIYFILGPSELHESAVRFLEQSMRRLGYGPAAEYRLSDLSMAAFATLVRAQSATRLYLRGAPKQEIAGNLGVLRAVPSDGRTTLVFFMTPGEYRAFSASAPAIALRTARKCPIGSQRALDAIEPRFQARLVAILDRIDAYDSQLSESVCQERSDKPDALVILQRWNSFSPLVPRRGTSVADADRAILQRIRREVRGGGYLLRWQGRGVAIDPGHDFVENLYEAGYSVADLDAVVLSHDHLDHTADFEALLDLVYQYNKRVVAGGSTSGGPVREKTLSVFANSTTWRKYRDSLRQYAEVSRVVNLGDAEPRFRQFGRLIRLYACRARHKELGGLEEALSLRFDLSFGAGGRRLSIGFTCDTGWHPGLAKFFAGVDILVPHIGSIKRYELEEARFYDHHLGILGLNYLLEELTTAGSRPVVVISEFGEELRGLRDMLGVELGRQFPDIQVFPGDIGHTIGLGPDGIQVMCGGVPGCADEARGFYEQDGEILLRCQEHYPSFGTFARPRDALVDPRGS